MRRHPQSLQATLQERGFRWTHTREMILHIFQTLPQGEHLCAEELCAILRDRGREISLSTVYRTLHLMTGIQLIRELEFAEGRKHYELCRTAEPPHHHLVCVQCNKTIEFIYDPIVAIGEREAQQHGYYVIDCQLTLYVLCPQAMQQGWREHLPQDWCCDRIGEKENGITE